MANIHRDFLNLMAIGDAFGMKYEFVDHPIPVNRDDLFYAPHPKFIEYQTAHYTDDVQKSLANGELILQKNPRKITRNDFVNAWLEAFKRDPRQGYSHFMFSLLSGNPSAETFCARMDASKGVTSGAAMGATPLGLPEDTELVKILTCEQATITHNTNAGVNSALAVSLSTHYLHHGGRLEFLPFFLDKHIGANWASPKNGLTDDPHNGLKIVSQGLNALGRTNSFSEVLLAGVSQTRVADTDTICAIAMAISSRRAEIKDDIPGVLRRELENGPYGANYLKNIDAQLLKKYPPSKQYAKFVP